MQALATRVPRAVARAWLAATAAQSFRSAYNKQAAERVLAKVAHIQSPK